MLKNFLIINQYVRVPDYHCQIITGKKFETSQFLPAKIAIPYPSKKTAPDTMVSDLGAAPARGNSARQQSMTRMLIVVCMRMKILLVV
jgi:hypothetical protein